MRVTTSNIAASLVLRARDLRKGLSVLTERVSTGERIRKVSDDPSVADDVARIDAARFRQENYLRNVSAGLRFAEQSSEVLHDVSQLVVRAKELAIQFSNSTLSDPSDFNVGAIEVQALVDEAIRLANTQIDGRYIFGGASATAPVNGAGVYAGDASPFELEMGDGLRVDVAVAGSPVFGNGAGEGNVVGALMALVTALQSNQNDNVRATIGALDTAFGAALSGQGVANTTAARIVRLRDVLESQVTANLERRDSAVGADMAETASAIASQEAALRAVYASIGRTTDLSLLDFLR